MKALLDSNFLMIPGEFRVDIFSELRGLGYNEFYTIDLVLKELEWLKKKGRKSKAVNVALEMIKKFGVKIIKTNGEHADEEILNIARKNKYAVCTMDKKLIHSLMESGVKIIILRQKKYLEEL